MTAQTSPDPAETLARARVQIVGTMKRLPKYTCVQTIDRNYYMRTEPMNTVNPSCDQAAADKKKGRNPLRLAYTDRVRLDVAEGDGREIHSWPGASHFETGYIEELVTRGPVATGSFGGYLVDILQNGGAQFDFAGSRTAAARQIFRYAYRVPLEMSHYKVRSGDGWSLTAYDGTLDIDAASLELLAVTVNTPELLRETNLCEVRSGLGYAKVRIGDGDFLLPSESRMRMLLRDTQETESRSVFTGCREFHADSVLRLDDAAETSGAGGVDGKSEARSALPPGVELPLRLDTAIDSEAAAAGDAVTATLIRPARDPKSHAILARAGEVAHGRIDRMEHWFGASPQFTIGIHWEYIGSGSDSAPFTAQFDRRGVPATVFPSRGVIALRTRPMPTTAPNVMIFVTGDNRHVVPAGLEMQWVTVESR